MQYTLVVSVKPSTVSLFHTRHYSAKVVRSDDVTVAERFYIPDDSDVIADILSFDIKFGLNLYNVSAAIIEQIDKSLKYCINVLKSYGTINTIFDDTN